MRHITPLTCRPLLHRFIPLAVLACTHLTVLASEPMPRMPPEKEPAAWQRAGIEAALAAHDFVVQYHALDYCLRKKWVAQLHFPTEQWLKWLGHENSEMQELAARASAQLSAQMPAEVQRALLRLLKDKSVDFQAQHAAREALWELGGGMIPEVQMEAVDFIQRPNADFEQQIHACKALGELGAAMTPATLEALLSQMKNPQTANGAGVYAPDVLAHLGVHMPPQVQEVMLRTLLDADADSMLRSLAAEAMGRLGPQIPPQALEFLLSLLRDPGVGETLRSVAASALALLGPHMPPEVQQALLAAYDEPPPPNADVVTNKYHILFHKKMTKALELTGPEMPAAFQQRLVGGFLKGAHAARKARLPVDGPALRALSGVRPQPDSAVIHALLAEFQDRGASKDTLTTIAEHFFQPLAARGALPPEVQQALLTCLQDEKAGKHVRCMAAQTLGSLGAHATPAAKQALLALLQNRNQPHSLYFYLVLAMKYLGPHMPPEAGPVLARIVQSAAIPRQDPFADPHAASSGGPMPDPFLPGAQPPLGADPGSSDSTPAADLENDPMDMLDESPIEVAVPALGNLGDKMPPEAQAALLGVLQHPVGSAQTPWDAAYALAQMGDKLPPQTQQRLLSLLYPSGVPVEYDLRLAIYQTLGVSGIHPVTDAQVADLLARTWLGEPDAELRFYLYLWLGRSSAHLQAVRWLGQQNENPPLGDTPPHEILSLISRLWPHTAAYAALRQGLARRTSLILTTHLKNRPLDAATQKVLRTLATQLAEDPAAECVTALGQVQAALAAEEKAR